MTLTDRHRKLAREILDAVEKWQTDSEMVSPNVERLPGIDALVKALEPSLRQERLEEHKRTEYATGHPLNCIRCIELDDPIAVKYARERLAALRSADAEGSGATSAKDGEKCG